MYWNIWNIDDDDDEAIVGTYLADNPEDAIKACIEEHDDLFEGKLRATQLRPDTVVTSVCPHAAAFVDFLAALRDEEGVK